MTSFLEKFREKKWNKITFSNYTKSLISISFIQALILIAIEIKLSYNNYGLNNQLQEYLDEDNALASSCGIKEIHNRFYLLIAENFIFIFYQIFQFYLTFNAIITSNIVQIVVKFLLDLCVVFYSVIQQTEVDIALDYVKDTCPGTYQLDTNYTNSNQYEYAYVAVSLASFILTFTIALKLYSASGFGAYKKVEYNLKIRKMYRTSLILRAVLKVDAFLVISYAIITAAALPILGKSKYQIVYYLHSVILVIAIFSIVLCHYSYTRESKPGIYLYFILWCICVADFAFLIADSVDAANSGWYFWTSLTVFNILLFLITFWYAVVAKSNFGHGLKEILIDEENYDDVESLLDKASKEYK
ncbi:hypothetical protein Glove_26g89 [Diversispora epigaea]|uniref:Uncharacterized protein n=1 Tax=Diversispora epigaea TaxID=1348612 RepID=A0A397JKJ2_9GLOM|nr:hypothetical protein Glove_26g89 [Diversispora epigaea]